MGRTLYRCQSAFNLFSTLFYRKVRVLHWAKYELGYILGVFGGHWPTILQKHNSAAETQSKADEYESSEN
jgi:hypothetical protein